jgi:hypothetical protein
MKILVTIAAPALVIFVTLPLCLYYDLFAQHITVTYESVGYSCDGDTCKITPYQLSTSFKPPWTYSFQCSSAFLESYLPNFIYLYTINGIVMPLIHFMVILYSSGDKSTKILGHSIFSIPDSSNELHLFQTQVEMSEIKSSATSSNNGDTIIKGVNRVTSLSKGDEFTIDMSDIIPSICVDITLLLTFGLASPLLAIPISFSIIINTLLLRLALGRYIVIVSSAIGQAACYQKLENAFSGIWKDLSGILILIIIIIISLLLLSLS